MITTNSKSVILTLPNYRVSCYKSNHNGDTVSLAIQTPLGRKQDLHLYVSELPLEAMQEFFTRTLEMLAKLPVKSKRQRKLKGL